MNISDFSNLDPITLTLMDASPNAMGVFTLEGICVTCNLLTASYAGLSGRDDVIGRDMLDFVSPAQRENVKQRIMEFLREQSNRVLIEFDWAPATGEMFPMELSVSPLRDETGAPIGIIATGRDISNRLTYEKNLLENEHRYRSLVENMLDGQCIIQDEDVVYMSRNFLEMLDYDVEPPPQLKLSDLHGDEELLRARDNINKLLDGKLALMPREYRMRKRTGELMPVEIVSTPIMLNGRPALQAVVRDLTHRKRRQAEDSHRMTLEEEVRRLREVNRLKTEFLSMVSHELRTPISVVLGILEMGISGQYGDMTQKATDRLGVAFRRGRQLANLINDLLDLASMESGRMQIHPELVTLEEQLQTLSDSFSERAKSKGVALNLVNRSTHRTFVTDRDRFAQILNNLLENALKFTPSGGRVECVFGDENVHELRFVVSDTGIGIPESLRERVFERFYRVDSQGRFGGTGLGLSIVREMALLLGGSVGLSETEGGGTTFSFTLPRFLRPPTAPRGDIPYHLPPRFDMPYVILIIDDDPDFASLIEDVYGKNSCVVKAALSGEAGLRIIDNENVDLLILDMLMPDLDGMEVCRRLRSAKETEDLPILIVSALSAKEKTEQALEAGANDFLIKPFDIWQLHERISTLLTGGKT